MAFLLESRAATQAASRTWPPLVVVAGLLAIGVMAYEDGTFGAAGALLDRLPGGETALFLTAMALVAVTTALLNLDTSVAFLTPVLIHVTRRRGSREEPFLYGCVFMSNAASLLLPGSNLTNLLVLADEHVSGSLFLARMAVPWLAAVTVTAAVVGTAFRHGKAPADPDPEPLPPPNALSVAGIVVAIVLILALRDSALPVVGVGILVASLRLGQGRLSLRRLRDGVDAPSLLGVFPIATALGTLARVWSYPAALMERAGSVSTAAIGALAAVLINNLPAAVLLGSRMPAHPRSLLFGLNIGPNLAMTASLSALSWWQAARSAGARPSACRYTAVDVVLVPLTLLAVLASRHMTA